MTERIARTVKIVAMAAALAALATTIVVTRSGPGPVRVDEEELRRTNRRLAIVRNELEALPDLGLTSAVKVTGCVYNPDGYDADRLRQPGARRTFDVSNDDAGEVDTQIGRALRQRGWRDDDEPDHGFEVYFFDRESWTAIAEVNAGEVRAYIDDAEPCRVRY